MATSDGRARRRGGQDRRRGGRPARTLRDPDAAQAPDHDGGRATGRRTGGAGGAVLGWLASGRNILGCVGALGGVALGVVGVVPEPWWPLGVAALYGAGARALPRRGSPGAAEPDDQDHRAEAARRRAGVEAQRGRLIGRAPTGVQRAAGQLAEALDELFDRPGLLRRGAPETFVIERLVDDYLPTALDAYLSLPRTFAGTHQLPDGRTPRQVLLDQLALLEQVVRETTEDASRAETDRLLAHGRFLADRFGPHALDLSGAAGTDAGSAPEGP
ncbi:hypothetical protein [Frankia nepalensis]|uniref:hypothetical protein n=1 Tax=Frankia nepalensis TaxID=1836974 RepID=UPI00288C1D14|nr:hypothetical protein [Frankia nepalensis]